MTSLNDIHVYYQIFESQFSANEYHGHLYANKAFDVKWGSIPILISAPHTTKMYRNGRLKDQDDYTGAIALLLQRYTDCYVIYSTRCSEEDPNFVLNGEYKDTIEKIVNLGNIKFMIDLHGASENREFGVDLGTQHGKILKPQVVKRLKNIFSKYHVMNIKENNNFPAMHPGTVSAFCYHQLGVPSVQMEINKRFRKPDVDIRLFISLIKSLKEIIYSLSLEEFN
ncbi:hypothetical protein J2S74_003853 [Evansella vedderi]|uniref:N-formylglutamate amidohydrolase n=1 Tax=Evansella vedderi TaxID=38282 RepID=A0ABU0A147_9BACI|nr:hypothetical protein [Evansella vedderi]MDQ0256433.1 hypothetical protein [Evansella vedderi]